jgi:hypothetical protein
MSPRKAAAAKPAAAKVALKKSAAASAASKAVPKAAPKAAPIAVGSASAEATRLAGELDRAVKDGRLDALSPQALQALMASLCRLYGAQVEAGQDFLPLAGRTSISPTEVMTTTSGILKAANLAVFELGMWQSWTGR